jgi:hypothetical protein
MIQLQYDLIVNLSIVKNSSNLNEECWELVLNNKINLANLNTFLVIYQQIKWALKKINPTWSFWIKHVM